MTKTTTATAADRALHAKLTKTHDVSQLNSTDKHNQVDDCTPKSLSSKNTGSNKTHNLNVLDANKLGLDANYLPNSVVEIIDKLTKAGFDAYIVGGGVRDQLLGLLPKDFDAVTNAKPSEIKSLFGKRCRIIGRRFQLAHVYSGRDMIEVATFRAPPSQKTGINHDGMVIRDNVWGSIYQDYARRDFTINALYYQPLEGKVYDFCRAIDDIYAKRIAFLGETQVRIDEDPVRLLRAIRFAAKLGFDLHDDVVKAFTTDNWRHLKTVSPHRLYEETLKIFGGGYVSRALPLLDRYRALDYLFAHPQTRVTSLIEHVAQNTDARIGDGKSINPAFFYAALLWPAYQSQLATALEHLPLVEAMNKAAISVINKQRQITAIPRFSENFIRETWSMQPRLIAPKARQIPAIAEQPRFRAAFDFLYLREQSGDLSTQQMGKWWHDYQAFETNDAKEQAIKALNRKQRRNQSDTIGMDEIALAAQDKDSVQLPKDAQSPVSRRRPKRKKTSQRLDHTHRTTTTDMLADTIKTEKPQVHD